MKKAHLSYLRRGIRLAINLQSSGRILEMMSNMRGGKAPVYGLIRDIVSDVRYYGVTEPNDFWLKYSEYAIAHFIEALTDEDWQNELILTGKKEDFLNEWFTNHAFCLSEGQEKEKLSTLANGLGGSQDIEYKGKIQQDPGPESQGAEKINNWVYDCTEGTDEDDDSNLPDELLEYNENSKKNYKIQHRRGMAKPRSAEADYLRAIDHDIVRLAEMIGRSGAAPENETGRFLRSGKSDIAGITIGNDLNSLLPSELALLAGQQTENIFYKKYIQNRLQVFASASHSVKDGKAQCGPIFMCIDTSGSMQGEPEKLAKTLALAIAIVAQRKHRPLVIVNYSCSLSFFVLRNLKCQRQKLLKFLSNSYDGGNDENLLFNFIFHDLPKLPKYKALSRYFEGDDLVIISDFEWSRLSPETKAILAEQRKNGMRFYGLGINVRAGIYSEYADDGFGFFYDCDCQYSYSNFSGLKEITPLKTNRKRL
ncbi:MAG: hypothetical protein NC115_05380 [Bacteroidales bacterium]|nr:hypothetical protein [Bacteroidales bacterium]